MIKKIKINIEDQTHDLLYDLFKTPDEGIEHVLTSFATLYKQTLAEISGIFTKGELYLIIDAFEGMAFNPQNAGKYLLAECFSAMDVDRFAVKWKVDEELFEKKLRAITSFQAACLELWANAYWYGAGATSETEKTDNDLERHIESLV